MSKLNSICVYCGSSPSNQPAFMEEANALGKYLGETGRKLVYGGASVGIMGEIANAALSVGGEVLGVMPNSLVEREVQHEGLTELVVVSGMHERKAHMVEASDGFIAMPGGFGTLDELFETITWSQLGYHNKPVGVLNVGGYFDNLLKFLQDCVDAKLVKPEHLASVLVASTGEALIEKMEAYEPANTGKWL